MAFNALICTQSMHILLRKIRMLRNDEKNSRILGDRFNVSSSLRQKIIINK